MTEAVIIQKPANQWTNQWNGFSIICGANQWTGFYMIMASVMKEWKKQIISDAWSEYYSAILVAYKNVGNWCIT